jgi:DNA-binding transcriptional regulator YhcF (GntR family)
MSASTPSTAEEIAALFRGAIRSGQLGDGERLPTVRQTARDFAVAQATAAKAYKTLEHDGLVITRTAAGTRVAPGASRAPQAVIENIRTLNNPRQHARVPLEDVIAVLRTLWSASITRSTEPDLRGDQEQSLTPVSPGDTSA